MALCTGRLPAVATTCVPVRYTKLQRHTTEPIPIDPIIR